MLQTLVSMSVFFAILQLAAWYVASSVYKLGEDTAFSVPETPM